ncbi:MAG: AsmA family protein [Gammaproteobacteria bacterium]|nr:AsmA family protein [Gammaproteobacteria bacterium]
MKKTLKLIGIIISSLIALLLVAVLAIPVLFNPKDYRGEIEQLVSDAAGRDLSINDDIELSLFPWIGITIGRVTLANSAAFGTGQFASIERAEVKFRLLPLLSQQIEASTVILHGLRLDLSIDDQGVTNWADLAGGQPEAPPVQPSDQALSATISESDGSSGSTGLVLLAIGGIQVKDAQVNYVDHANDVRYAINQLNLETGPLTLGAPLDVFLSSQFEASQPAIRGQIEFRTLIKADLANERYRFDSTTLNATLNGSDLPGGQAVVTIAGDIALDMAQQTAAVSSFKLSSYGLDLSGELNFEQLLSDLIFDGNLHLAEFNPKTLLPALGIELPETTDATALNRIQLAFALSGSATQYKLDQLVLMLDESRIEGALQLGMSGAPLPAVRYDLTIDQLDLDRYLPPPVDETADAVAPVVTPAIAGAAVSTLPLETLRALDLVGNLNIDKLKVSGLQLSALRTKVHAADGIIRMDPLSALLYQGEYSGEMQLDVRGDQPRISLNESVMQVHVGPLLKDYMGEDKVSGVGTMQVTLTAVGETPAAITKSLNGTANIAFVDGAIKGFNIVQMVSEAKAKLKGRPVPSVSAEMRDTDFAELTASFKIKNGVVNNRDLSIKSPFLRLGGDGQVNLVNETINYLATIVLSKTNEGQGGGELDELRGLKLPVRVTGTFAEPKFKPELSDVLKVQAKAALAKEKAKLKAKARAKLDQLKADEKAALKEKIAAEKARLERKAKEKLKALFGR